MRLIIVFLLVQLLLSSCATAPVARPLTNAQLAAVYSAEAFVVRHGFMDAGHPPNMPIENVELFDPFASRDDVVKRRRGTLESRAFGIARAAQGVYWVLFRRLDHPDSFHAITVEGSEAKGVVHSALQLEELHWRPVPGS